jgi:hypothetical protein
VEKKFKRRLTVDPFKLLKRDHKKVSGLLKELEQTKEQDSSTREQLFQQIKNELEIHTHIEETIFYPALKEEEDTKDITLEAYEEHAAVKRLLEEMSELDASDETWGAKCSVLKENVEHHVEEEEGEMFNKAKKALESDELEELGDQMIQAKNAAQGRTSRLGRDEKSEDMEPEDEELVGISAHTGLSEGRSVGRTSRGSSRSSSGSRSRGSAARSSGSRSRSKSSVKSAKRKVSKKKSSSKKTSKKKSKKKASRWG